MSPYYSQTDPFMNNKSFVFNLLLAGISLGTAWAIRGQFGHEQGAAWAGGIGGLSIVLLSKRRDWYAKAFQLALASAAGWGVGGIISYGIVVGYGRGTDFGNVYYGFLMLFVIGGLFGLLGGGLFGLMLADNPAKPVKWHRLITEMTASAVIFYYLLIEEFGWLMTPPRSEAWAACAGMTIAMFWYMIRNQRFAALRVAIFAGLGGGFGFAFGNFLQVLGSVSGIKFNFWNVMEYSIGFFGGIGMAYGTFTSDWEQSTSKLDKKKLLAPLIILTLIIPFVVWDQSFETERIIKIIQTVAPDRESSNLVDFIQRGALFLVFPLCIYALNKFCRTGSIEPDFDNLKTFFLAYLGLYIAFSLLMTGAFMSLYRIEQYLYIGNFIILAFLIGRFEPQFINRGQNISRWFVNFLFILAAIALLTAVAVNSHGTLAGAHNRF